MNAFLLEYLPVVVFAGIAAVLGLGFMLAAIANWMMVAGSPAFVSLIGFGEYRFVLLTQIVQSAAMIVGALIFVPLFGAQGAFLALVAAMLVNLPMIEHRFVRHEPGYRAFLPRLADMKARVGIGLAMLIVPTLALAVIDDFRLYWLVTGLATLAIAWLVWREPLVQKVLRRLLAKLGRDKPAELAGR